MEQVTMSPVSQLADGPVELSAELLAFVGGGLPKGTWTELSADTVVEALPKGTWEA